MKPAPATMPTNIEAYHLWHALHEALSAHSGMARRAHERRGFRHSCPHPLATAETQHCELVLLCDTELSSVFVIFPLRILMFTWLS